MSKNTNPQTLNEQGKQAYQSGQLDRAVDSFRAAAEAYAFAHDDLNVAESKNNLSVALLQSGNAQESLDVAFGTDDIFAKAGDLKRQGMALGNQAAALEALKRFDDALAAYEHSAAVLAEAGEGDLRAMVLKSAAAIKLRKGKISESAFKMMSSLESKQNPSIFDRLIRALLRFVQR
jgi:tetratricopeptide (TPR) repeat protein